MLVHISREEYALIYAIKILVVQKFTSCSVAFWCYVTNLLSSRLCNRDNLQGEQQRCP